jgi:hypothetical protein
MALAASDVLSLTCSPEQVMVELDLTEALEAVC